jgi:quercetin dioxygenase-like cupin family protein
MSAEPIQHIAWSAIPEQPLKPGLTRQFAAGRQAMVSRIQLAKGTLVPTHAHHNEQVSVLLSGALLFTLGEPGDEVEKTVRPGEILIIPGGVPHSALALEDTENLDFFAPPREDWISGNDTYLRTPQA